MAYKFDFKEALAVIIREGVNWYAVFSAQLKTNKEY